MHTMTAFAEALLHPARPCPPGFRSWNHTDPQGRFAIYRNNVTASLIHALADTYPVVQQLVGEEFFQAMAHCFVQSQPPRTRQLVFYGTDLPAFIENFAPAACVPYLADIGRLEMGRIRAYHAADTESLSLIQAQLALQEAAPDTLQLALHPSLQWLQSPHAVHSIWLAHQTDRLTSTFLTEPSESVWIFRQALDVYVLPVPASWVTFARLLAAGNNLCEAAVLTTASAHFDLPLALSTLLRHGLVTRINATSEHTAANPPIPSTSPCGLHND